MASYIPFNNHQINNTIKYVIMAYNKNNKKDFILFVIKKNIREYHIVIIIYLIHTNLYNIDIEYMFNVKYIEIIINNILLYIFEKYRYQKTIISIVKIMYIFFENIYLNIFLLKSENSFISLHSFVDSSLDKENFSFNKKFFINDLVFLISIL